MKKKRGVSKEQRLLTDYEYFEYRFNGRVFAHYKPQEEWYYLDEIDEIWHAAWRSEGGPANYRKDFLPLSHLALTIKYGANYPGSVGELEKKLAKVETKLVKVQKQEVKYQKSVVRLKAQLEKRTK